MLTSFKLPSRFSESSRAGVLCVSLLIGAVAVPAQQTSSHAPQGGGEQQSKKITGLAVITLTEAEGGGNVFHADGYRIRLAPNGDVDFSGSLKSVADVGPNTWIRFEGLRGEDGGVIASKADFYPPGSRKALTKMGPRKPVKVPEYQLVTLDSTIDANGKIVGRRKKLRLSEAEGSCGWHWVPGNEKLQMRVERVGLSIVPAYQKLLKQDDPSCIPFRFYAVSAERVRSSMGCERGLVLVPQTVVERLKNDDQLAAVLADAVAFHLKRELTTFTATDAAGITTLALSTIPAAYVSGYVATLAINHAEIMQFERSVERTALQLVADVGYDPWQAPEAWRLLAPKEAPKDASTIDYSNEGKYQLEILKLQYKRANPTDR